MVLAHCPGFRDQWQRHLDWWDGKEPGLCSSMAEFSHYVLDLFNRKKQPELSRIFRLIETFIVEGDEEVQAAAATCFLENLFDVFCHPSPLNACIG